MRSDLTTAMRARETTKVRALRTALAAIANAEAPPADVAPDPAHGRRSEHARLLLSTDDVVRIVRHEIDDRYDTIERISGRDREDEMAELRAEIEVLEAYLR